VSFCKKKDCQINIAGCKKSPHFTINCSAASNIGGFIENSEIPFGMINPY
jgi:hypothetical protein